MEKIEFTSMDLNCECGQLVAKSISNDGRLGLQNAKSPNLDMNHLVLDSETNR